MIHDSAVEPISPIIEPSTELRTFLIADVRGYTRFTQERGDADAARLVTRFAAITRAEVRLRGGKVIELRGDEALAVFTSARQALRAAIGLQARYASETEKDPTLPLAVGIGLDAGEAVPLEGGYRGDALNLAARLCNLAGPGEVLASEGVVYLGRRVDGVAYAMRGAVQMKGFADPVRIVKVIREADAAALPGAEVTLTGIEAPLPIGGFLGALPSGVLVGREWEWQHILDTLEAVTQGTGRVLLLSGEPGVGKTRLAQEVTLKARHWGFLLATGRCYEPEQAVPFYPFLEALGMIYAASPAYVRAEIPRRWPYLARLLPELFDVPGPTSTDRGFYASVTMARSSASLEQEDQQRLFRAVAGFIEMVADDMPVAILIDDLQWADDSTLQLLRHMARYTRGHRVLLLGTYRDVEMHRQHPLETTLLDLSREQLIDEIEIGRLDQEGTAALIAEIIGEKDGIAELVELVYQRTDGNAFFVQEVMRALVEQGDLYRRDCRWESRAINEMEVPKSIRSAIGQRLSQLEESAQEILLEASVLGQEHTFDELLALVRQISSSQEGAERAEDEIEYALKRGVEAGLLRETAPDRYAFNHALTQQALYAELSTRRRKRLHLAAGRALQALAEQHLSGHHRDGRASGSPAELAWHFLEGDDAEQALHYALIAGDRADEVFANGDAERHFRTALELAHELHDRPHEIEALERLSAVLTIVGRYDKAIELLERAARLNRDAGNIEGVACAVAQLGHVQFLRGTSNEGIDRLKPLIDALDGAEPSFGLAALWSALARLYMDCDRDEESLRAAERAVELTRAIGDQDGADRLLIGAEITQAAVLWRLGRQEETLRLVEELIPRAEAEGDLDNLGRALSNAAMYYGWRGEMEKDRVYHERLLELAERRGDRGQMLLATMALSGHAFLTGDWPLARTYRERTEGVIHVLRAPKLSTWPYAAAGWLALREGNLDAARTKAEEILSSGNGDYTRIAHRLLAETDLLDANYSHIERGRRALERLESLPHQMGSHEDSGHLRTLAWAYAESGDEQAAMTPAAEAVAQARSDQAHPDLVEALVIDGMVLGRLQRWEEAEKDFAEACSLAEHMPMPFGEGRALYEWGIMCLAQEKPEEAREKLEAALTLFTRLGAKLDASRAEEALQGLLPTTI